jgi:hypothetical protein
MQSVYVLSSAASLDPPYFSTSHKWQDFREKSDITQMCVLIFSKTFIWNISRSKKNSTRYCHNCENVFFWSTSYSCLILNLNFLNRFSAKAQISNFIKIRPVGADLFHAVGRLDTHDEANSRFSQFCECAWKLFVCRRLPEYTEIVITTTE